METAWLIALLREGQGGRRQAQPAPDRPSGRESTPPEGQRSLGSTQLPQTRADPSHDLMHCLRSKSSANSRKGPLWEGAFPLLLERAVTRLGGGCRAQPQGVGPHRLQPRRRVGKMTATRNTCGVMQGQRGRARLWRIAGTWSPFRSCSACRPALRRVPSLWWWLLRGW